MSVPARKATPSAIDAVVRTRSTLCATMPRRVATNMVAGPQALHVVENGVGRGLGDLGVALAAGGAGRALGHLVDDLAVGEEEHAVRVAGGDRIVRDHDNGLTEVLDGLA